MDVTPGGLGSRLNALWVNHKKELMVGGAGVAAVAGYLHHQNAAASDASSSTPGTSDAAAGAGIAGYTTDPSVGGAAYDSTANDVYNALQPQIAQTQTFLTKLQNLLAKQGKQITRETAAANRARKAAERAAAREKKLEKRLEKKAHGHGGSKGKHHTGRGGKPGPSHGSSVAIHAPAASPRRVLPQQANRAKLQPPPPTRVAPRGRR